MVRITPPPSPYRSPFAQASSWWARYGAGWAVSGGLLASPWPLAPWQLAQAAIPREGMPSW